MRTPVEMIALFHSASWYQPPTEGRPPHVNGANLAFCDNHVRFIPFRELWDSKTNGRAQWNYDHEPHPETWLGR